MLSKKLKSKSLILIVFLVAAVFILSACAQDDKLEQQPVEIDQKTKEDNQNLSEEEISEEIKDIEEKYSKESQAEKIIEVDDYTATSPFTALPLKEANYRRAIAVSIENSPAARPQTGLEKAEIVYEFMLEGGITRFLAIYWPEMPVKVGPIRSARPALVKTANFYDALFLHAGASPDGFKILAEENILHLDQIYQSKYFWRSSKRRAPHNLYSGKKALDEYLKKLSEKEYPEQFNFLTASIISDFKKALKITVDYWGSYAVLYEYNSLENNYSRFLNQRDNPHLMESGKQINVKNIIVQFVKTATKDSEGRQEIDLESGGKMLLFRDGIAITGKWENMRDQIIYFDSNGEEVEINPGQTWIQVVPNGTEINYEDEV